MSVMDEQRITFTLICMCSREMLPCDQREHKLPQKKFDRFRWIHWDEHARMENGEGMGRWCKGGWIGDG